MVRGSSNSHCTFFNKGKYCLGVRRIPRNLLLPEWYMGPRGLSSVLTKLSGLPPVYFLNLPPFYQHPPLDWRILRAGSVSGLLPASLSYCYST